MKKLILIPIMVLCFTFIAQSQTRIVCVGNSITYGTGTSDPATKSWPAQLAVKLGSGYVVYDRGVPGTTMFKNVGYSYWSTTEFTQAKNDNPNILIICLGTNDSWSGYLDAHLGEWYGDYAAMIDAFRANGRNPKIYVCFPAPIFGDASKNSNLTNLLIPRIKQIRDNKGTWFINFNEQMADYGYTFIDGLHPNDEGAAVMSQIAYNSIVGTSGKSGSYSLQNRNSGQYMDISGGSNVDGATVLQWTSNGNANQKFWLNEISSGVYNIQSVSSGKYLDIEGKSGVSGANCLQWSYSGGNNQRFTLLATDNGYYKLRAVHSSRILDVYGASTIAGTKIIQWDDNNQTNAQWKLISVSATKSAQITKGNDEVTSSEILLYPNPVTNMATLENVPSNTEITLYDLTGKVLLTKKSSTGNVIFDLSNLKAGVYFIKVGENRNIKLIKN